MRVLVATDGSKDASEAVEWLAHFPLPPDAALAVVSAVQPSLPGETAVGVPWQELREQGERVIADARRRLTRRWMTVTGRVLEGEPRHVIIEAAADSGSDLVVLGARGLGAIASLLLGSVSLGVARHAPCSVLVCKGAARPVSAVTVAVDGSPDARSALAFFSRLPLPSALAVRLIGVVERIQYPSAPEMLIPEVLEAVERAQSDRRRELDKILAAAADELRPRVRSVSTVTPSGAPAHMIVREAEDRVSDLIVVGARGLGTFDRIVLGSVSESVLRHATCPVLIARSHA